MAVFRCTITATAYNQISVQNVVHFSWTDFAGPLSQVTTELVNGWITILRATQTNSIIYRNVSVYEVGTGVTPTNLPMNLQGQDLGDPNASMPVLAVKLRIRTGIAGRTGRGRIYVFGIRQAHWSFGQLTAAGITTWQGRVDALKQRYIGPNQTGPMNLGVMNRSDDPSAFKLADELTLSTIPGIQRRRNLGVGI